jgi:hypothetical protein
MQVSSESEMWARETFGTAELGHQRRTKRLLKVATDLANSFGLSLAASTQEDPAALEGAYRLIRNRRVAAESIAAAGFRATAARAALASTLLAIEDTTTTNYEHSAADELGDVGAPKATTTRGFLVHSVLLVDQESGHTVGLAEQRYWTRDPAQHGRAKERRKRAYETKESFKWQSASESVRALLGDERMADVISVCDREADIYEYLSTRLRRRERFIVRASTDRGAADDEDNLGRLWPMMEQTREVTRLRVEVPQRGGRMARQATLVVRTRRLRLRRPKHTSAQWPRSLKLGVVFAREEDPPAGVEPLEWMLLTTEPVGRSSSALTVLRSYRRRWRIEEFHKAWKSGAGVERCRMQHADNLRRMAVILAFVAVRMMQLRERFETEPEAPCDTVLSETEWKILWVAVEKTRPPKRAPSIRWAYRSIGRLAGWHDTKRTGRVGAKTLMAGWTKLEERVAGYEAIKFLDGKSGK